MSDPTHWNKEVKTKNQLGETETQSSESNPQHDGHSWEGTHNPSLP